MQISHEYKLPDKIWAVDVETSAITRISCSPLDHSHEDRTAYWHDDIVDRLVSALRAQVYTHGFVTEDAGDVLDLVDALNQEDES